METVDSEKSSKLKLFIDNSYITKNITNFCLFALVESL